MVSWQCSLVTGQVVVFTDEFVVVEHVQFLSRRQLLPAHQTCEAIQVEHFVAGFPNQITRRYALSATAALSTVSPAKRNKVIQDAATGERMSLVLPKARDLRLPKGKVRILMKIGILTLKNQTIMEKP